MDLYQLKMFFTLCKARNYTETARIMCVTQSAVSHALIKLEKSIAIKLIKRKGRDFSLTEAGKALYTSCETIFYELEKTTDELKQIQKNSIWNITLGSPIEFGTTILLKHMKAFMDINPNINVDFLFSHNLYQPFIRDEVDFIIDCKDHDFPEAEKIFLFKEQYVIVASHAYIKQNNIKDIADLRNVKILSMDKSANWWNNFLAVLLDQEKDILKNIMQINNVRGIVNGAINGLGVGFVPKYTVISELKEKILVDPFPCKQPATDDFNIFIKPKKKNIRRNKILIEYLTSIKPFEFGYSEKIRYRRNIREGANMSV
jgi:DNA-binding transcriptional LysR family regulator